MTERKHTGRGGADAIRRDVAEADAGEQARWGTPPENAGISPPAASFFKDIEVGGTFYLGRHRLKKTGENQAEGVDFNPDAAVSLRPSLIF